MFRFLVRAMVYLDFRDTNGQEQSIDWIQIARERSKINLLSNS